MNKVLIMKGSSFTSVKNSFEIMAAKFVPYFEGEKKEYNGHNVDTPTMKINKILGVFQL